MASPTPDQRLEEVEYSEAAQSASEAAPSSFTSVAVTDDNRNSGTGDDTIGSNCDGSCTSTGHGTRATRGRELLRLSMPADLDLVGVFTEPDRQFSVVRARERLADATGQMDVSRRDLE